MDTHYFQAYFLTSFWTPVIGHNIAIFEGTKSLEERLWYANMVIQEGWSRSALVDSIKIKTYKRHGKAITNFQDRLPDPHSRLAHDTLKDPYNFDFLELAREHIEKDLEEGLLKHVEKFLSELGQGFSFVGRQVNLVVGGKDFYIDLLFYHLKLNWKYAIRGKSIRDELDIRVIVSLDKDGMAIITVMYVGGN